MSSVRASWRMQRTVRSTVPLGYAVPPPSTLGSPTGAAAAGCSTKAASLQQMRHMPEVASANCIHEMEEGNTLLNTDQSKPTEAAQACARVVEAEVREASRRRGKHVSSRDHGASPQPPLA